MLSVIPLFYKLLSACPSTPPASHKLSWFNDIYSIFTTEIVFDRVIFQSFSYKQHCSPCCVAQTNNDWSSAAWQVTHSHSLHNKANPPSVSILTLL